MTLAQTVATVEPMLPVPPTPLGPKLVAVDGHLSADEPSQAASRGEPETKPAPGLSVCLADVEAEEVEWLWYPYIPKGKLTSIEGDPGIGKSWFTMELAAEVSTGRKMPGSARGSNPQSVLLLTMEDGAGDTIRPRLDALDADVTKVHVITAPLPLDSLGARTLKDEIVKLNAALVVIDPIVGYLPANTDMNNSSAVRPVLARLAKVAEETGATIVFVRHLAKSPKEKAIYRGLGSIDFTAACRSVLMVGADPTNPTKRVVAHAKSNLAAKGRSHAYTIKSGKFTWLGSSSLSAEDLGAAPDPERTSALEDATEFLLEFLSDGARCATEVQAEADKQDISWASVKRAKKALGIRPKKEAEHWIWALPEPKEQLPEDWEEVVQTRDR